MSLNKSDVIALIRSILSSINSSVSVSKLNKEFKNETGVDIPSFGYENISDFLHSLSHTVKLTGIYPVQTVSLIPNDKSGHIKRLVDQQNCLKNQRTCSSGRNFYKKAQNSGRYTAQKIQKMGGQKNIKTFEQENKNCENFWQGNRTSKDFEQGKKKSKDSEEENKNSKDFWQGNRTIETFEQENKNSKNFWQESKKIKDSEEENKTSKDIEQGNKKSKDFDEENKNQNSVPLEESWPKNSFCCFDRVPLIDMKLHADVGKYIEVFIFEIINPYKFYFQLRKFKKELSSFMNDLQMFYETQKGIPPVTDNFLQAKQICAALHKTDEGSKWYRAEICQILGDSHVIVHLIDFGQLVQIPNKNLKCLHQKFITFPRQAFLGFLANIRPLNTKCKWPSSAIERFCDLALQRDLVAGVVHLDEEAYAMGVALSSTSGQEIHVNDTLVKEKYAKFEKVSSSECIVNGNKYGRVHKLKDFLDNSKPSPEKSCKEFYKPVSTEEARNGFSKGYSSSVPANERQRHFFYAENIYGNNQRLKNMFSVDNNNS